MQYLKNVEHGKVQKLGSIISYVDKEVDIVTLIDDVYSKIAIQALDINIAIKEHVTTGDVMLYVIAGKISAVCNDKEYFIGADNALFIKKGTKLVETAVEKSKVLLIVVRGEQEVLIDNVIFDKVVNLKTLVNTTENDITFTNMKHFAFVIKELDSNERMERVNGARDCMIFDLQGEADISVEEKLQHLDTDEFIVISSNTIYSIETIAAMKFLLIYAREKSTKIDY
jgi:mannose-6-phosphate isomerase-like protein (cupin superfamily)